MYVHTMYAVLNTGYYLNLKSDKLDYKCIFKINDTFLSPNFLRSPQKIEKISYFALTLLSNFKKVGDLFIFSGLSHNI